ARAAELFGPECAAHPAFDRRLPHCLATIRGVSCGRPVHWRGRTGRSSRRGPCTSSPTCAAARTPAPAPASDPPMPPPEPRPDEHIPLLRMVLAVAAVVAVVILVFFAIGYGIGRVFV
ncbi:hypothetical protein ACVU7I_03215, partial [Patulibacter sp. S7RM1-6]